MAGRQSKIEKEREKQIQQRVQTVLSGMLKDEDNKYCVDCDSKGPRWASWNLGIFLCIRCAGIHRNLGVHISKVKSVNLDSWTPQQVSSMQQMGNSRARSVYEANLPEDFRRPQTDSAVEAFVRQKYEKKKFLLSNWEPSKPPEIPTGWLEGEDVSTPAKAKTEVGKKIVLPAKNSSAPVTPRPVQKTEPPKPVTTPVVPSSSSSSSSASTDLLGLLTSPTPPGASLPSSTLPTILPTSTLPSSASSDLLSLQAEFGDFASASPVLPQNQTSISTELLSSGTVTAPAPGDSGKMSTDSIMALFGSQQQQQQQVPTHTQMFPGIQQPLNTAQFGGNNNLLVSNTSSSYPALGQAQTVGGSQQNNPFLADTGLLGNQLGGLNLGQGQTSLWQ